MKKLLLILVGTLALMSCEKETLLDETAIVNSDSYLKTNKASKVAICHTNGKIKYISENALPAHIAHGDAVDLDGDGFFDKENPCADGVDCDDTNAAVNPDAEEIYTDDIDNNCNGNIGYIEEVQEESNCTDCTNGTSGKYKHFRTGRCRDDISSLPPRQARYWSACYTTVIKYID
jgi:hypothetical protein